MTDTTLAIPLDNSPLDSLAPVATRRPSVLPCNRLGGRSPLTNKPVKTRHRWSGAAWGEGQCLYCGRTLDQVLATNHDAYASDRPLLDSSDGMWLKPKTLGNS